MNRATRSLMLVPALAVAVIGAASCSEDSGDDGGTAPSTSTVQVESAWARTSPMMVSVGAAYFAITSTADDRLVSVSVDPSIAARVEIHETVPADGEMSHGDGEMDHGAGTAMTMREMADGLPLPAADTVVLKPGGYHLMLMDLVEPLAVGEQFELTLNLEQAGAVPVSVEVRDEAPSGK